MAHGPSNSAQNDDTDGFDRFGSLIGGPQQSAKLACAFFATCREQVYDLFRTHHESHEDHESFIKQVGAKFLKRDETAYSEAMAQAKLSAGQQSRPQNETVSKASGPYCFWNAKGSATTRLADSITRVRGCPGKHERLSREVRQVACSSSIWPEGASQNGPRAWHF